MHYRFCVPDEWYRRPSRIAPSKPSFKPTEETLKRLSELDDEDSEGENTAKQKRNSIIASGPQSPTSDKSNSPSSSGTFSSARLSTMFGSWLGSTSSQELANEERRLVSEPIAMDNSGRGPGDSVDEDDFEKMIVIIDRLRFVLQTYLFYEGRPGLERRKESSDAQLTTGSQALPPRTKPIDEILPVLKVRSLSSSWLRCILRALASGADSTQPRPSIDRGRKPDEEAIGIMGRLK